MQHLATQLSFHTEFTASLRPALHVVSPRGSNGLSQLFNLSDEDVKACVDAYTYLQNGTSDLAGAGSDSEVETEHVRKYYRVLQPLLRIADIEKMYIPPQIDAKQGEIYR